MPGGQGRRSTYDGSIDATAEAGDEIEGGWRREELDRLSHHHAILYRSDVLTNTSVPEKEVKDVQQTQQRRTSLKKWKAQRHDGLSAWAAPMDCNLMALGRSRLSYVAAAAEISVTGGNKIKIHRIVGATDCGYAVGCETANLL